MWLRLPGVVAAGRVRIAVQLCARIYPQALSCVLPGIWRTSRRPDPQPHALRLSCVRYLSKPWRSGLKSSGEQRHGAAALAWIPCYAAGISGFCSGRWWPYWCWRHTARRGIAPGMGLPVPSRRCFLRFDGGISLLSRPLACRPVRDRTVAHQRRRLAGRANRKLRRQLLYGRSGGLWSPRHAPTPFMRSRNRLCFLAQSTANHLRHIHGRWRSDWPRPTLR